MVLRYLTHTILHSSASLRVSFHLSYSLFWPLFIRGELAWWRREAVGGRPSSGNIPNRQNLETLRESFKFPCSPQIDRIWGGSHLMWSLLWDITLQKRSINILQTTGVVLILINTSFNGSGLLTIIELLSMSVEIFYILIYMRFIKVFLLKFTW